MRIDLSEEEDMEGEEDNTEIPEDDLENEVSARPRRMSEFNVGTKIVPIPNASSFFIFSPTNRFRIFCHYVCNHSIFGNIILVCIMISSAMLAAEDPLDSHSKRNQVSLFGGFYIIFRKSALVSWLDEVFLSNFSCFLLSFVQLCKKKRKKKKSSLPRFFVIYSRDEV